MKPIPSAPWIWAGLWLYDPKNNGRSVIAWLLQLHPRSYGMLMRKSSCSLRSLIKRTSVRKSKLANWRGSCREGDLTCPQLFQASQPRHQTWEWWSLQITCASATLGLMYMSDLKNLAVPLSQKLWKQIIDWCFKLVSFGAAIDNWNRLKNSLEFVHR